jgi:uncharacterized protein YdiU (UPF0061 family)
MALAGFRFDNSYARDLAGMYLPVAAAPSPAPRLLRLNAALAAEMGLDAGALASPAGVAALAGMGGLEGAEPIAMAYAGHQFGGFSPQLGDGRALLLGEHIGPDGLRRDIHLKGSGPTPFSRRGDGKAVLGPVLREYLMGEAMAGLGIPTTRALAALTTGEVVMRDGPEPGAILVRTAASHLRVGTFQFFAARGETDRLRLLADHAIARHYPDLAGQPDRALRLLERVCEAQARLIAQWMLVGFVHGVMNTDNMAISGETIDYGPCAFVDAHDPAAVFSSIDHGGRYAYGNQPGIAQWNLARFAETLLDLIDPADGDRAIQAATGVLAGFGAAYDRHWLAGMRVKLGLTGVQDGDMDLAQGFWAAMEGQGVDLTLAFRALPAAAAGDDGPIRVLFADPGAVAGWLGRWRARLAGDPLAPQDRAVAMNRANPVYIPRNHMVEAALSAARDGDLEPFERMLALVSAPHDPVPGAEAWALPAPQGFGRYRTFCGT